MTTARIMIDLVLPDGVSAGDAGDFLFCWLDGLAANNALPMDDNGDKVIEAFDTWAIAR